MIEFLHNSKKSSTFEGTDTALPSHLESTFVSCGAYAREKVFFAKRAEPFLFSARMTIREQAPNSHPFTKKHREKSLLLAKKSLSPCICAIFVVPLCPIFDSKRTNHEI